jgi:uncharacterized membrane protein
MNMRAVIQLSALGLAWVGTSLLSSHLQLLILQELSPDSGFSKKLAKKVSMLLLAALTSATFFYFAFLLAQSLSNGSVMSRGPVLAVAVLAGLVSVVKYFIHDSQDVKIFGSPRNESLKHHHDVDQIITPFWTILIILAAFLGAFVWTEDWIISLLFGLLNVIFFGLLMLKFSSHNFKYILRWERSILIEPITMALLSYCVFLYIDKLPFQTSDRSMLFILSVYIIAIVHNILSQLLEITQSSIVSKV